MGLNNTWLRHDTNWNDIESIESWVHMQAHGFMGIKSVKQERNYVRNEQYEMAKTIYDWDVYIVMKYWEYWMQEWNIYVQWSLWEIQ